IVLRVCRISNEGAPALRLEIEDEGDGIPQEDLPFIFERFYKADKSRKRTRGTGLGLAIVKNLVEAHEGSITVRSRLGQGTTFTVTLPVQPKASAVEKRR